MGIRHDVEEGLEKYEITKIDGQPTDEDLNLLAKELTNAAGSVATQNGGGEHGHVGMVIDEAEYIIHHLLQKWCQICRSNESRTLPNNRRRRQSHP